MFQYVSLKNKNFSPLNNHHIIIMPKIINRIALIFKKLELKFLYCLLNCFSYLIYLNQDQNKDQYITFG